VEHDGRTIFAGIPSAMTCTRYHSLIVEDEGLPEVLEVSAWAVVNDAGEHPMEDAGSAGRGVAGRGTIMALRHRELPIEGVQFHPESVLTVHGKQIIENFLRM